MNRSTSNDYTGQNIFLGSIVILFLGGAILMWLIGNAAALLGRGRVLHAGLTQSWDALLHLRQHTDDPRLAWAPKLAADLPGPVMYWGRSSPLTGPSSTIYVDDSGVKAGGSRILVLGGVKVRPHGALMREIRHLREQTGFSREFKIQWNQSGVACGLLRPHRSAGGI
jgi:hypothetical protein